MGDNGIINKTLRAKENAEIESEKEDLKVAYAAAKTAKAFETDDTPVSAEELQKELTSQNQGGVASGTDVIRVVYPSGRKYYVKTDGSIDDQGPKLILTYELKKNDDETWEEDAVVRAHIENENLLKQELEIDAHNQIVNMLDNKTDSQIEQIVVDKFTQEDGYSYSGIEEVFTKNFRWYSSYENAKNDMGSVYALAYNMLYYRFYYVDIRIEVTDPYGNTAMSNVYYENNESYNEYEGRYTFSANGDYTFVAKAGYLTETLTINVNDLDEESEWKYRINDDDTVTLLKYRGKDTVVNVPSTMEGKIVTGLGEYPKSGYLRGSQIWDTSICSVRYEGSYKYVEQETITKVIIPEGIKGICDHAFSNSLALKEVDIPSTVNAIGDYAFESCNNISSIYIPTNVKQIGIFAFYKWTAAQVINFQGSKFGSTWDGSGLTVNWNVEPSQSN